MTSTASPAIWLQTAIARHIAAAPAGTGGRHRAPEEPSTVEYLTSEQIAAGPGRHADPSQN